MAQFPEIHPEKCPYCGSQLKLVTGKYLWDYYYECTKCYPRRRYHFKNDAMPDIKAVYQSEEYQRFLYYKKKEEADSAPATIASNTKGATFMPYTCKVFINYDNRGVRISAEAQLQDYLNSNRITPDRIVSISSGGAGGWIEITLVHI